MRLIDTKKRTRKATAAPGKENSTLQARRLRTINETQQAARYYWTINTYTVLTAPFITPTAPPLCVVLIPYLLFIFPRTSLSCRPIGWNDAFQRKNVSQRSRWPTGTGHLVNRSSFLGVLSVYFTLPNVIPSPLSRLPNVVVGYYIMLIIFCWNSFLGGALIGRRTPRLGSHTCSA